MADEAQLIGEVIESSTTEFVAESRELHSPPSFGSFVKVRLDGIEGAHAADAEEDPFVSTAGSCNRVPAIYGVVYQATTAPIDVGRKLRAF